MMKKALVTFLLASCLLLTALTTRVAAAPSLVAPLAVPTPAPTPPGEPANVANNTNPQTTGGNNEGRQTEQQTGKDLAAEERIRQALTGAGINGIEPAVKNDAVSLRGEVSDENQKTKALNIVKKVPGINDKKINADGLRIAKTNSNPNNNGTLGRVSGDQTGANQQPPNGKKPPEDTDDGSWSFLDLLYKVLLIMGGLLLIGLIGYAIWKLITHIRRSIDSYFRGVKKGQDELAAKFDNSMAGLKKEFNLRTNELQDQIGILSRNLTDNRREILDGIRKSSPATMPAGYPGYVEQMAAPKEKVNTFPISVDEYLDRMKRVSMVVKPDFQNEILVQDPDGRGELMLVQDHEAAPGGLYYVVPKVGYLQAKQEFFGYYEKYYDCPRLMLGEVWIVEPAVVDKVSGGWKLREKGELEIK